MIRLFTVACCLMAVVPTLHAREIIVEPDPSGGTPIAAALKQAKPGDVVTLREGTYREAVKVPAGEPSAPLTLRAADGERVVITGMVPIDGWEAGDGGVFSATLDWKPDQLYVGDHPLTKARTPEEGFWIAEEAGDNTLTDPANLRDLDTDPTGGTLRVWAQRGNTFLTVPISGYDAAAGALTLDPGEKPARLQAGDRYFLTNRAAYVDQPGEWAVAPGIRDGIETRY